MLIVWASRGLRATVSASSGKDGAGRAGAVPRPAGANPREGVAPEVRARGAPAVAQGEQPRRDREHRHADRRVNVEHPGEVQDGGRGGSGDGGQRARSGSPQALSPRPTRSGRGSVWMVACRAGTAGPGTGCSVSLLYAGAALRRCPSVRTVSNITCLMKSSSCRRPTPSSIRSDGCTECGETPCGRSLCRQLRTVCAAGSSSGRREALVDRTAVGDVRDGEVGGWR